MSGSFDRQNDFVNGMALADSFENPVTGAPHATAPRAGHLLFPDHLFCSLAAPPGAQGPHARPHLASTGSCRMQVPFQPWSAKNTTVCVAVDGSLVPDIDDATYPSARVCQVAQHRSPLPPPPTLPAPQECAPVHSRPADCVRSSNPQSVRQFRLTQLVEITQLRSSMLPSHVPGHGIAVAPPA